ncbi:MAG: glycosyltransferase family 4 protein [Lentisphaerae bacterium]|nr:glycosyltransferase family 4 protein [Lentisphaerota bacterium]
MNTLFLIPAEVGGSETYLRRTLPALAAAGAGDTFVLFTNRNNDAVLRQDLAAFPNVRFERLECDAANRYARILREQIELPRRAARAGIDVLWSPGYTTPCLCPCPMAVSILDVQYRSHPEVMGRIARLTTRVLVPLAARRSRLVLTLSEFARGEIEAAFGLPPERIRVTPLAADPAFGRALPEAVRRRLLRTVGVAPPYLLTVSNSYPHKNLDTAVAAFGRLQRDFPHRLAVVGRPRRGEPALRRAVAALPDPARVLRRHYLSGEALTAVYQAADAFLFPSRYEGFGLPVLEAMTAGTPVVATRRASLPELGGDTVDYADPDDPDAFAAVVREVLTRPPEQRRTRCEAARNRAATFSWTRTASLTAAALREAASSAG